MNAGSTVLRILLFIFGPFRQSPYSGRGKPSLKRKCPISLDDDLNQLGIPLTEGEVLSSDVICTGEYRPATY